MSHLADSPVPSVIPPSGGETASDIVRHARKGDDFNEQKWIYMRILTSVIQQAGIGSSKETVLVDTGSNVNELPLSFVEA